MAKFRGKNPGGLHNCEGEATIEFIGVAVMLLVPLFYLIMVVANVQAAAFAATGASSQISRLVTWHNLDQTTLQRTLDLAVSDFGLNGASSQVEVTCRPTCQGVNANAVVRVEMDVPLPLVPDFLASALPLSIPVTTVQSSQFERWSVP